MASRARSAVWAVAERALGGGRARSDPKWRRVATLAAAAVCAHARKLGGRATSAAAAEEQRLWRKQMSAMAAEGHLDFSALKQVLACTLSASPPWPPPPRSSQRFVHPQASSLPTLLKLLWVPTVRGQACRTIGAIAATTKERGGMEQQAESLVHELARLLASNSGGARQCGAMGVSGRQCAPCSFGEGGQMDDRSYRNGAGVSCCRHRGCASMPVARW
jgi:hypothetical protein